MESIFLKNRTIFLLCLFLPVLLAGCKEKNTSDENNIGFNSIEKNAIYHLFNDETNPGCNLDIKFTYPASYGDEKILKELQDKFVVSAFGEKYAGHDPQSALESYAESYVQSYKELEPDFLKEKENFPDENPASWYNYTENRANEVFFNRARILSFINKMENYTGGAHGSHQFINNVIDLATGKWIRENDIFLENFKEPVARLIIDKIVENNQVESAEKLLDIGYFSIDEIQPNGNILVNEQGITYTFNEYEIAAYVIGPTKVLLPYDELSFYLKKESPISHLYK